YSLAMQRATVSLREGVGFVGIRTRAGRRGRREVTAVQTTAGTIATRRVLLTGGPALQAVAAAAGARAWVGYVRHQVAVTERSDAVHADTTAMAFDLDAGLYWRPEEGGLLFGMSNPKESPGPGRSIDWPYLHAMERRLHRFVPATRGLGLKKVWAATIEYTPDHLPIVGPLVLVDGTQVDGASIASACGHGMMWGPAVSRIATDLALEGATDVVERPSDLRMDRFDADGRSAFVDPIALPFPVQVE
ncbi:MAG: FAD-binding oxidoreductase, partial [Actinomycetota bacterium]|nr:FAD-binding oxidoreductase [Actinomycetota bacterium]